MKKLIFFSACLFLCVIIYGQKKIVAQSELLGIYDLNSTRFHFSDVGSEDAFCLRAEGPFVDDNGIIHFIDGVDFILKDGKTIKGDPDFCTINSDGFESRLSQNGCINYHYKFENSKIFKIENPVVVDESKLLKPKDIERPTYVGRLRSGHIVWIGPYKSNSGDYYRYICREDGTLEVVIHFPEIKYDENTLMPRFSVVMGNWGEFYICLPPRPVRKVVKLGGGGGDYDERFVWEGGDVKILAVRTHLKEFGILNDSYVRLRKGPSTSTESLGSFPVNTGFRILEKGTEIQTIGGQQNVWYKVRLQDGTEGYFFGAFVHVLYDGPGTELPWPNVPVN